MLNSFTRADDVVNEKSLNFTIHLAGFLSKSLEQEN